MSNIYQVNLTKKHTESFLVKAEDLEGAIKIITEGSTSAHGVIVIDAVTKLQVDEAFPVILTEDEQNLESKT